MVTSSPALMSTWARTLHYQNAVTQLTKLTITRPGHTPRRDEESAVADAAVREEGEGGQQPAPSPRRHVGRVGDVDPDTAEQLLPDNVTLLFHG